MSCNDKHHDQDSNCVADILKFIAELQDCATGPTSAGCAVSCEMPFLGANPAMPVANTRPVALKPMGCCDNFRANFYLPLPGGTSFFVQESEVFRVESVDENVAVLRPLAIRTATTSPAIPYLDAPVQFGDVFTSGNTLVATNSCITVDLRCFCSVQCLPDMNITGV